MSMLSLTAQFIDKNFTKYTKLFFIVKSSQCHTAEALGAAFRDIF